MRRRANRPFGDDGITQLLTARLALLAASVIALAVIVSAIVLPSRGWPFLSGGNREGSTPNPGSDGLHGARPPGPLYGVHVVVDPGHGGADRGACHFPSSLIEKEINLDMALRLEEALRQADAVVSLTRRDDTFISLDDRARFANERGADLFISLHVNRFPSSDCYGAQTFYLPSSEEGRRLALLIQEELLDVYPPNYRRALPGDYRVLRESQMPAALVEIGFVTSPVDRELMAQTDYRDQVAAAIVEACIRFVRGDVPASPSTADTGVTHDSVPAPIHDPIQINSLPAAPPVAVTAFPLVEG